MVTYYARGNDAFTAAGLWNTASDGSGTPATASDLGGGVYGVVAAGNTLDLNGFTVSMAVSIQAALIQAASGKLTTSGSRAINANLSYTGSGQTTAGMLQAGGALAINGTLTNGSNGDLLYASNQSVTLTGAGGIAIQNTGAGRCFYTAGSGTHAIMGNVVASAGYGLFKNGANNGTVTGNLFGSGGAAWYENSNAGSWTIDGDIGGSSGIAVVRVVSGTLTWIGSRAVAAGETVVVSVNGGTLTLANASAALAVAVAGKLAIWRTAGTVTASAGGGEAQARLLTASAQAAGLGFDLIVVGATLPAAENVLFGSGAYGYAGSPITPLAPRIPRNVGLSGGL